jgi:uncharacterized membrane protein
MSRVEDFLTQEEEQEIVEAIIVAEQSTSGEIRVHLESHTRLEPMERAKELFHLLKMDNTKDANGVLIYVAVNDRKFAICGDYGIDQKVGHNFWDSTRDIIQRHFKEGHNKKGLVAGILEAGRVLQQYFPWKSNDTNELSNEVSKS